MRGRGADGFISVTAAGAAVLLVAAVARPTVPPPSRWRDQPWCAPPAAAVEEVGAGLRCLPADAALGRGLSSGDRLRAGGASGRMAPARLALVGAPVDANTAPLDELASLPGVGEGIARRIALARPFASVEAVRAVPGLGGRRWLAIRRRLIVGAAGYRAAPR